jgi:hypothetical protein
VHKGIIPLVSTRNPCATALVSPHAFETWAVSRDRFCEWSERTICQPVQRDQADAQYQAPHLTVLVGRVVIVRESDEYLAFLRRFDLGEEIDAVLLCLDDIPRLVNAAEYLSKGARD